MKHTYMGTMSINYKGEYYLKMPNFNADQDYLFKEYMGRKVEITITDVKEVKDEIRNLAFAPV
uniref:Uncharacterized protein n=1 Tax=viral metagenome TaxID=1070528 RepID=A0A6M3IP05_9ZZZZ